MTEIVQEKLELLPNSPGVYIMKDEQGRIIYVGKAVILKNRVRQYFQNSRNHSAKVKAMVAKIADFETIITGSEIEALILECNLIKQHRPRYNISLKDDKTYPYIKVTTTEPYPRVLITRRVVKDGSRYFGPYTDAGAVHATLKLLRRLFPLRSCRQMTSQRPCLEYHIKRCLAPCTGKVDAQEYAAMIRFVCFFLEGRSEAVEKDLEQGMDAAAEDFAFERAARLRDQLTAVRKIREKQNIVTGSGDQDAIGLARSDQGVCIQVLLIRGGKMVGGEHFMMNGSEDEADTSILTAFMKQYYDRATFVPREILLPLEIDEKILIEAWLSEKKAVKVALEQPRRGTKKDIVVMAANNAEKYLADAAIKLERAVAQTTGAVEDLGRYLGLAALPRRMECFDISHIQGSETVASMVVFEDGVPKKSAYRRFKIKSTEGKPDDFLSMREVTSRRYG
ncbi:MAG: excinuclease ABC subunit UvrC, partial [Selenomonadaceae bacterium]